MQKKILIVEDEQRMREIVTDYFKASGFEVFEAGDGKRAIEIFSENHIDIVILDIMIPELDGWSVCRRIRKESDVPIIMLTARSDENDKLMGFELGADDYVTKPFSPNVLVARVKTLLKRVEGTIKSENQIISIKEIEINKQSHTVKMNEEMIQVSPKEFQLLCYFIENKGIVLSRDNILNKVWGYDYFGDERVVDTHVKKLRKKLGDKADYIRTVIRLGYKFEVIDEE